MLCGVTASIAPVTGGEGGTIGAVVVRGMITSITGMGFNRKSVTNIHNSLPSNWARVLYSCIAQQKPFQVGIVFDTNDQTSISLILVAMQHMIITWPVEAGYSTGGTYATFGGITDISFGASDLEGRIEGSFTFTPTGIPVITPGTTP